MKVLIVDDSRTMRMVIRRALRQAGYGGHEFAEAENGREGLKEVQQFAPDLILSDWNMPEMSGIDFLKTLRQLGNKTPFGFITSEGSEEMRQRANDAGADFLLSKPFTAEDVSSTLARYLG